MNNNYHTQLNKSDQMNNNVLNEVAYENNLMQNFQGTPIKPNQYNSQILYPTQQSNISNPPNISGSSKITDEEIELSETRNDSNTTIEQRQINQQLQEVIQNNALNSQQYPEQYNDHDSLRDFKGQNIPIDLRAGTETINQMGTHGLQHNSNIQSVPPHLKGKTAYVDTQQYRDRFSAHPIGIPKNNQFNTFVPNTNMLPPGMQMNPHTGMPTNPHSVHLDNSKSKDSTFTNYIIIPLIIAILFVFLVYPKTSNLIEKIVPPMTNFKGYLIRGAILGLACIVLKFIADSIKK